MTTATLGFAIDSRPASSAAVDLEKLYAAAVKVEGAADRLEAAVIGLGTALGQTGQGAERAKAPVDQLGRSLSQQDDHVRAFRMELERLTMKYQPLAQATKNYEASVGEINRAHQLGIISAQQMQKALDAERLAYDRLKTAANSASNAVQAANNNMRSGGAQGFNAANAGYQFQDIAVTAAMGMNPLMIGLQQGTQLASVVATMERPVAGLAAAFASLVSPVSLVTIGLTAGAAALIQYVSSWSGGDEISDELAAQNELIAKVAERWGDATPALKAYADQLERTREIEEIQQAVAVRSGQEYEKIAASLSTFEDRYSDFVSVLTAASNATGSQRTEISDLGTAFVILQERIGAGRATIEDFDRVRSAATRAAGMEGADEIGLLSAGMDELTRSTSAARDELIKLQRDAAIALNSAYPSRGVYPGVLRSPDGTIQNDPYPLPFEGPVPGRRPLIELEGLPGSGEAPTIVNSDGRLVSVPVPGRRPNYFERESDLPQFSSFRANRNTYWDRSVLDEESRRKELGGALNDFFTDFGDALRSNGGDLGKALMESLSNALMNAASAAWDRLASQISNALVNAFLGQPSAGLMNKGIGFTGANTTLGQILGAGGDLSANDNMAGGFSGLSSVPETDIASYIRDAAVKRGIDPNVALAVAKSEGGLNSWNLQSNYIKNGVREPSFGPFQLYKGGGLGNEFMAKTGLDPALAANGPAGVDFALDHAAKNGWGAWYGAKNVGIGNWQGIGAGGADTASAALDKLASASGEATVNLGGFGKGLGQLGQSLSTSYFPSAPSAPGGGGGLFSMLGGLFGGQQNLSQYIGKVGLFANGTPYAPGGLAIVGEKGPELVDLPQGAQVFSNHKSMDMMRNANSGKGGNQLPPLTVVVQGGSGDDHIRELARQGAQEVLWQYNEDQINGGFGANQKRYNSRVG